MNSTIPSKRDDTPDAGRNPGTVSGVLEDAGRNGGFLRDPDRSYRPSPADAWVPADLIRKYGLVEGALVEAEAHPDGRGPKVSDVISVCGLTPDRFRDRTRFEKLQAVNPSERIRIGDSGNPSMRFFDLVAPLGKGTRGMIVAPPKAGKTRILEELAAAIRYTEPQARIVVLLIDERPEEVTQFRRGVDAEVLASSSDEDTASHVRLAELTLAHVRADLECGRDAVVLVDSLTRMARAFNRHTPGRGRTLSGGVDASALEIPRRFFGMARKAEHGGSVTVLATAMVDTGSRMDDYIFEEFKGTGNSELVLDRSLAEARVFPAVNIQASGTRREELLVTPEELKGMTGLRRKLSGLEPKAAAQELIKLIAGSRDNEELLRAFAP